jgi:hypothetical protein
VLAVYGSVASLAPSLWQVGFPPDITSQVISDKNPAGVLTNSDLKMAGVLYHFLALEQMGVPLRHASVTIGCDNSPAVAWTQRMAARAASPVVYCLLRGLAMWKRTTQATPPRTKPRGWRY